MSLQLDKAKPMIRQADKIEPTSIKVDEKIIA